MKVPTEERRAGKPRQVRKTRAKPASGVKPALVNSGKFSASDIVMRNPRDLKPFPNNPKIHTPKQVEAIAANMEAFGFDQPILVDELDQILKGHGRQLASLKNDYAQVPTIVRKGLSDNDKWAVVISDNALPALTGFDKKLLSIGLTQLAKFDYPLNVTGFDQIRLATFGIGLPEGNGDPDENLEPEAKPISRPGDIWILGNHRIICGDSTDAKTVEAMLDGDEPRLMVTDPPYGVDYDANWRSTARNGDGSLLSTGKGRAKGKVVNDHNADWSEAWKLFPGNVAYIWHASLRTGAVQDSIEAVDFEVRTHIVWVKNNIAVGRGDYQWQHEPCWYAVRRGKSGEWAGDRKQSTTWFIDKPQKSETGHSTQKPVECMKRPIENNSKLGDMVYEPFAGSGTTIIAAEMTGRHCRAIELNPVYVDLCVRRWAKFAGAKAILKGTAKSFEQIERERSKRKAA